MNSHSPTPASPGENGDGLDQMLRAFFRAEMPAEWPAAPLSAAEPARLTLLPSPGRNGHHAPAAVPAPVVRPAAGWSGLTRSRFALAASVALLVAGPWLLSTSSVPHPEGGESLTIHGGSASPVLPAHRMGDGASELPAVPKVRVRETFDQTPDGPTTIRIIVDEEPPAPGK